MWLNESLLPRLLHDSALLRDTGSVLLGTLRLRQIRDTQGETEIWSKCGNFGSLIRQTYWVLTHEKYIFMFYFVFLCLVFLSFFLSHKMFNITSTPISKHLQLILFHVWINSSVEIYLVADHSVWGKNFVTSQITDAENATALGAYNTNR